MSYRDYIPENERTRIQDNYNSYKERMTEIQQQKNLDDMRRKQEVKKDKIKTTKSPNSYKKRKQKTR